MASLGDEIAKLSNPTPQFFCTDEDDCSSISKEILYDESKSIFEKSALRSQTAPLLEDVDEAYVGRKVSRKSRGLLFEKDEKKKSNYDEKQNVDNDSDSSLNSSEDTRSLDSDEELSSENDISNFKKNLQNESLSDDEKSGNESSESTGDETEKDNMFSQFANIDVNNDIEKGNAIKVQQEIWNKLCECRIKLQKLLIIVNKLPQTKDWITVKTVIGEEINEPLDKGNDSIKGLLDSLITLKEQLKEQTSKENKSDSEIEVSSDNDEKNHRVKDNFEKTTIKKSVKRKNKSDDYSEILSNNFNSEKQYRNSVIQKWDEKVKLSTGRMTQKSFNSFGNSAVKQIEQILQDKNRLLKRTQLKRSVYRVLGKPEFSDNGKNIPSNTQNLESKQDLLLKDHDPQIYDDDDFYRQLLKDIIQNKSVGIDSSIIRKQMELQKIRNKMKRKVDTKASKGRKLRYDIHPKLVNYMAPVHTSAISEDARENLMKCLFGKSNLS